MGAGAGRVKRVMRFLLVIFVFPILVAAQSLGEKIATIAAGAEGRVAVSCAVAGVRLDCHLLAGSRPPMQSVFKFPMAMAALDRVEASGETLALICVDLDHFKEANDLHGHLAGDAVLVEAARRLQDSVQAPSFAARLGGDEFVVVQITDEDQPTAAAELAGRLLETLKDGMTYEGQDLAMAASLGVSLYPDDGRTGEALLANADMALYRAKENGRGT